MLALHWLSLTYSLRHPLTYTPDAHGSILGPVWYTVNRFGSERSFSCDQIIFLMCFVYFLAKQHKAFKRKVTISRFPFPQVVQKH